MKDEDARSLAVCAGVAAFALAYLCAAFLELPVLAYFQDRHAWRFVVHAPPEAMTYLGLVLWGIVIGVDAAVITLFAARTLARTAPSSTFRALSTGWTLLSLVLAAAYFVLRART